MIHFETFKLANGLRVIVHPDESTPMAVLNVMYDVGARDEDPEHTGFAHLFEHLMFGGSRHITNYDGPLQLAGGENNAYTTNDLTDYYIQLPAENLETAFWLESDRMLSLAFSPQSLDVQRKVVSEEFKEHYINKPYGDVWQHLRALAYKKHPYRWMTIGEKLAHIEEASLDMVKAFFQKHYSPANAILAVGGAVTTPLVKELAEKWFADIPAGEKYNRNLITEPLQTEDRYAVVEKPVPLDAIYKAWHIAGRLDPAYYSADLLTEILGSGGSSRLYYRLVKQKKLFSSINCYQLGSIEPGLLVIEGKLVKGVSPEDADAAIMEVIHEIKQKGVTEQELQKARNQTESTLAFEDMNLMNRVNNLAYYELLGDINLMNAEWDKYNSVSLEQINRDAAVIFRKGNMNTLFYKSAGFAGSEEEEEEEFEEEED